MDKDRMLDELAVLQERFSNGMGWRDGEYEEALDEAISLISEMPSADVVEVVRCKDCKHFVETGGTRGGCFLFQGMTNPRSDDFCSEGERKEEK